MAVAGSVHPRRLRVRAIYRMRQTADGRREVRPTQSGVGPSEHPDAASRRPL